MPSTVLAALARSGQVADPYFGRNLEAIPADQFQQPWWYRTEFAIDEPPAPGARLVIEGINYRADVWLNGRKIADRQELAGAFRMFELDVSSHLAVGVNALAIRVHPPEPGEFTIGFVDWNPTPPDRNMGLWREVKLRLTGGVALDEVFVRSDVDVPSLETASVIVSATLRNDLDREVTAVVAATIGEAIRIEHREVLPPREKRRIQLSPDRFEQLVIDEPRLWWPNNLGEPHLYRLALSVAVDGRVADRQELSFGIRHVEDYLTEDGYRGYAVNGKKVLIRGGGWVDDLMLDASDQNLEDQIRYVEHMNLNTIRLEGFWGTSHELFDLADRHGILVMVGWSCQWEWEEYLGGPVDEFGGIDTPAEMELITRSLRDQVVWLRNHPSVLVWVLASDMLPRPELETRYRTALSETDPTRPVLASCAADASEVSGPSGVKMNGPYEWVPPNYWYLDRQRGGAYGFNTETGPGPQPPPAGSIRRMMPRENWWPIDEMWEYHCGRNEFNTLDRYKEALDNRYGSAGDLEEFARLAQVANYEGMRAMFEAFSIRRPATTGIIQWMLNSAWPEMYWQLYDHYLVPNGAFYGARDASRPVNIAFDYENRGVIVVNDTLAPLAGVTARVRVFDLDSQVLFDESSGLDVPAGALRRLLTVPPVSPDGKSYFVDARIAAGDGSLVASSLYWLSTEDDVSDWDNSEWFYTPTASYADLTGLARMPTVELDVEHRFEESAAGGRTLLVSLENPSDKLAFFIELRVVGAESGQLAAPILWSDNYISLLPGERRQARAELPAHALAGEAPVFHYSGLNVGGG
ncbi:MAG: glycoside hydrolase family 2 TIM barrel-domain containing protein [Thermoanaerobaculia bacterium]|nr:glycoside hydrolase family 2 TIM barrel-domain containing protein [Thermoanaerobaculia bacterium]